MKYLAIAALAGFVLIGCGKDATPPPGAPSNPEAGATPAPVVEMAPELNVGDIEAKLEFELTLDPESPVEGVTSEELRSSLKKLNMMTTTIDGVRPAELFLAIDMETQLEFPERPVAVRGRVVRDLENGQEETIYTFQTILDENASIRKRRVEGEYPPLHFKTDALQGLAEIPETMLLHAELDIVIMPEGTDPKTLDPSTAEGASEDTAIILSNPMRINYIPGAAPAPEMETAPNIGVPTPGAPDAAPAAEAPADAVGAPAAEAPAEAEAPAAESVPAEAPAADPSN